jgi:hypothetical protein
MKSKRKTPSPSIHPQAKPQAKLKPKALSASRLTTNASATTPATSAEMSAERAATSAASSTTSTSISASTSTSTAAQPTTPNQDLKATRDNISGTGTSLSQMLSNFPEIVGHDEYDFRGLADQNEMAVANNYEICREAIRQSLLRIPTLYSQALADTLAEVLRSEPALIVLPAEHGDMHYFSSMSEALCIWQACAPGTPLPPPFPSIIDKVRKYRSKEHYEPAVGVELMDGPVYVKSVASQRISRTFLVHVPIVGDMARLNAASEQIEKAIKASGLLNNNGGGREPTHVLAMGYYRLSQGNKHTKARLWYKDKLRKDDEGVTPFGRKLYEVAIEGADESPSESAWSDGVSRIEELVMPLANRLMQLVAYGLIKPTPKEDVMADGA